MISNDEIISLLKSESMPVCVELTPFEILDASNEGYVLLEFKPQPAFGNHFGNVQGGFAVAMLDLVISSAAFSKIRKWPPTIEMKTSFMAPLEIGKCVGEGKVIRAGKNIVFTEGKIINAKGDVAVHATATQIIPK